MLKHLVWGDSMIVYLGFSHSGIIASSGDFPSRLYLLGLRPGDLDIDPMGFSQIGFDGLVIVE